MTGPVPIRERTGVADSDRNITRSMLQHEVWRRVDTTSDAAAIFGATERDKLVQLAAELFRELERRAVDTEPAA